MRVGLFDSGNKGASLSVENGGVLLLTTASGLSIARSCRSTVSVQQDDSDVEFVLFAAPDTAPSIANKVSIGLCTAAASMSAYIGADGESIGYRPAEGQIHTGGASVEAVATAGLGSVIKVAIAFDGSGGGSVAWYVDGALLTSRALPAGMEDSDLYFAVSLGSDVAAGDIRVQVNAGAWQFEYPTPGLSGWWEAPELEEAVRVSTFPYLSRHDDDPENTRWEDGITRRGFTERRAINVWWWGDDRQVQGSVLALQLTDPDGRLDFLLSGQYRDQPVRLQSVDTADALADAEDLGTYYFDRCEVDDDQTKTVYLRDVISLLELRLQPRRFRPDVDPQSANRVHATLIGVAGSIPTQLVDADGSSSDSTPILQLSGQDVEAFGKVREAGVPLDSATDYSILVGGQQIQLTATPDEGEITLDASRTGAAYTPPSPVDAIGGDGDPFTGTPSDGTFDNWFAFEDNGALLTDHMPYYDPADLGRAYFPQEPGALSHIEHKTDTLVAGTRYRYSYTVYQLQPAIGTSVSPTQVGLTYGDGQFQRYSNCLSNEGPFPKVVTGTFVCEATHAPNVYYAGNDVVGGQPAILGALTFIELPPLDDAGDDEAVEDALPTLGLEDAMRMILEDLGGMAPSVWASEDAAAIDLETGFAGGGVYFENQATRREALERLMPGYTAGIYKGRDGRLRVARMVLPALEISSDMPVIEAKDFLGPLIPRADPGLGLTRLVGVRRNERVLNDSDLNKLGLTMTQRARLARRHRYVLATGANFAPGLDHVDAADPLDTALWFKADGQATADFAGEAYASGNGFYTARMPYRADIDLMTVVLLQYDRYGMEAGVPAVVVGLVEDRVNGIFEEIEFWGPAPYAD
jgi:hypothetical protein